MKRALFFTLFFCLSLIPCLAQENTACPKIKVSASKDKYDPGETMQFSISVTENPNNLKLEYEWQISAGTISNGQGTLAVMVETIGLDGTTVTATVKIKGLPGNCENQFYADVIINSRIICVLPADELQGPQTNNEIKARLDALYTALLNNPTTIAVIMNNGTDKQVAARTAQILRVIRSRKYDKNRFKFVRGSSEPGIRTSLWIVPKPEAENFKP